MAKKYPNISESIKKFIEDQKIFFVATGAKNGRINISPKGMNSFRVINENRVIWLNVTGSGNETAAHIIENKRMTIMFISLTDKPMILRLYGNANVIHKNDKNWSEMISLFDNLPGSRQIFDVQIDLVQTSCGMAIPFYEYIGEREQLNEWANKKGELGIKEYWREKNQISLDGKKTNIVKKNL